MYTNKDDLVLPRYSNGDFVNPEDEKLFNKFFRFAPIEGQPTNTGYLYKKKITVVEVKGGEQNHNRIDELELSVRVEKALKNDGINTIDQLLIKDEKSLLRMPNFGWGSLREVKTLLREMGLELGHPRPGNLLALSTTNTFEVEIGKIYSRKELINLLVKKNIEFDVVKGDAKEIQIVTTK